VNRLENGTTLKVWILFLVERKDTSLWVATNTTSKKGLKGRLVVFVTVVGFGFYHVMHERIAD
jgi:hypothetical protein